MNNLDKLQEVTIKELLDYFAMGKEEDLAGARLAQSTLTTVARLRATERVRDATQFGVIRVLSKDKEQLAEYIRISLPHLMPVKQIA